MPGAPGVVDEHLQGVRVQPEGAPESPSRCAVALQAGSHPYGGKIRLAGEPVEMPEIPDELVGVYAQVLRDEAAESRLEGGSGCPFVAWCCRSNGRLPHGDSLRRGLAPVLQSPA